MSKNKTHLKTKERQNQDSTQDPKVHLTLSIIEHLKSGKRPSQIEADLSLKHSTFMYHFNKIKDAGLIHKLGYGVWAVTEKNVQSRHVGKTRPPIFMQQKLTFFEQDTVRAHAFLFTVKVPKDLRNWTNEKREQYLEKHKIEYIRLKISGSGQRIIFRNRKVWLLNKSIVIYNTGSYFAEHAIEAKSTAIYKFFSVVKGIERLLHVEFAHDNNYKFKVSRQHYALLQNALAKQYTEEGKKLEVRTDKGLWFIIDNSFNLNEAETVHPETAMTDNVKMQNLFNSVKRQPNGITIDQLLELSDGIQRNQILFSENALKHVEVIKDLGTGVKELNKLLGCLKR